MKMLPTLALAALLALTAVVPPAQAQDHPTSSQRSDHPTGATAAKGNDILAVAAEAGNCETFVRAVKAAGLAERLGGEGPFTVFAPTDAAFRELPEGTVSSLLEPANKARLAGILACHVVPGKLLKDDMKTMKATSVSGQDLQVKVTDAGVTVDGASVVTADIEASNGVIHTIDAVIMPSGDAPARKSEKPKDHPAH